MRVKINYSEGFMKKLLFLAGIISMLLIFGMALVGCDDGTKQIGDNTEVTQNRSTTVDETSRAVAAKPKAPAAPSTPKVTDKASNYIAISWSSVSGANGYRVYRSLKPSPDSSYTLVKDQVPQASPYYTDYNVKADTPYYYKVTAYTTAAGEGSRSPYVSVRTEKVTKPAVPSKPTVTATNSNSITISWPYVVGADGYKVFRSLSATGTYAFIKQAPWAINPSFTDTGLKANTPYYYKVAAFNTAGDSKSQSPYVPAKTLK
jgi:fibronectin type 3 domain-containing protein